MPPERDVRPFARQAADDGSADSAAAAGDERTSVSQSEVHESFP
jgi:hypothetical protein